MRKIKIHNQNLVSLRIDESVRNAFYNILTKAGDSNNLFLILSRPNFEFQFPEKVDIIFKDSSSLFDLILKINGDMIDKLSTIYWAWEAYEHFSLLLTEKLVLSNPRKILHSTAEEKAFYNGGFLLFRGIEEDVLWISKASNLKFDQLFPTDSNISNEYF